MKKILFLCAMAIFAFACGKDDVDADPETYSIAVTGGTASVEGLEVIEAYEGDEVTLTVGEPETGMEFVEWKSDDVEIVNNKFTMPAKNVVITAEFRIITFEIEVDGGTASVDGNEVSKAAEGDEVTLTPNTLPGNDFVEWESDDVVITDNTFTMPAQNVTIKAIFAKTTYNITVTGGTAAIDGNAVNVAAEGDEVTLTPNTLPGNDFLEWESDDVVITNNTFTMPGNSVTVRAVFDKVTYNIEVDGGTASIDGGVVNVASVDDEITLEPASRPGFEFVEWQSDDVEIVDNAFTMPAKNVSITAIFDKIPYDIEVDGGTASVNGNVVSVATINDEVSLTPGTRPGYKFDKWESSDVTISGNKFTMPAKNVKVKAVFSEVPSVQKGTVSVKFSTAPSNAPIDVRWIKDDYVNYGTHQPSGTIQIPTYDGVVEIVFFSGSRPAYKFLLRADDQVQVNYSSATGAPSITSLKESSFDAIYNFPASTTSSNFDTKLEQTDMPAVFKKYYREAYRDPSNVVYDDELVRYYSINNKLSTYMDGVMRDLLITHGAANMGDEVLAEFNDIIADNNIHIFSKMVLLRKILGTGMSFVNMPDQIVCMRKYMELSGEDFVGNKYTPFSGAQPSIDVSLENNKGNMFALSDLIAQNRGKIIYIDFWASWCEPCIATMPMSIELRPMYPDVLFLYLSIDDASSEREDWLEAEKNFGLPNSYRVTNQSSSSFMNSALKLSGVPRYVLFDREGKMVYDNAPMPSGDLGILFEQY